MYMKSKSQKSKREIKIKSNIKLLENGHPPNKKWFIIYIITQAYPYSLLGVFFVASDFLTVITGFKLFNDTLW